MTDIKEPINTTSDGTFLSVVCENPKNVLSAKSSPPGITPLITTQLRLAPETEDERRARLEYLSDYPIYIPNNLYLILIVAF